MSQTLIATSGIMTIMLSAGLPPPTSALTVCDEPQRGRKVIHTLLS